MSRKEVLESVVGVLALGAIRAPETQHPEGLPARSNSRMQNIGVAQREIARVKRLARPAWTHNVRDAGRELAVLDQDVRNVFARAQNLLVREPSQLP